VQATETEFKNRFWLVAGVFTLGFGAYRVDHVPLADTLARLLSGGELRAGTERAIMGVAAGVVGLGALLRSWATAYLDGSVVHDAHLHAEQLVADGPYRHTRNPLYLGMVLFAVGYAFAASRLGAPVMVLGTLVVALRLIGREEAALSLSQGASYDRFRRAVPRLWPSVRPRLPASGARPRWGRALASELMMWGFAATLGVFAVVLDPRVIGAGMLLSFVGHAVALMVVARPR
jgi:protein-S-isoprenylcysteine O-methyltransferase Ste14